MSEPADQSVADLLARCLRAEGVRRAFRADGSEVPDLAGIEVLDVGEPALAAVLADADGRLPGPGGPGAGVALLPGRRVRISSQPGRAVAPQPVLDASSLVLAVGGWDLGEVHAAVELDLDLDLRQPVPEGVEPLALDLSGTDLVTLSPQLAELPTAVVVGPGVVRDGQVAGVAELARLTGAGVAATWGALGVLPLDHPAWLGTIGLQAGDVALSGVDRAQLLIVSGLDEPEAAAAVPSSGQVLVVEPWHLGLMAMRWPEPQHRPSGSELTAGLARLASDAAAGGGPASPWRAARDVVGAVGPDGVVAADAGPVGLWLARGVVPCRPGGVVAPALACRGFAAASALVGGLDDRHVVGVTTGPTDPSTDALVDLAGRLGTRLVLEVWGDDADPEGLGEQRSAALAGAGPARLGVPVELTETLRLVELAGEVVAWADRG